MAPKVQVAIGFEAQNLDKMDDIVEGTDEWDSRSQFVREAIREQLQVYEGDA